MFSQRQNSDLHNTGNLWRATGNFRADIRALEMAKYGSAFW